MAYISVVVATRDVESTIDQCLSSLDTQTERPQLLVIDALSTDRTCKLALPYLRGGDILLSEADCGIYDAWNKGVRRAQGEWIVFLGADDHLPDPDALAKLTTTLHRTKRDVVYGRVRGRSSGIVENGPWAAIGGSLNDGMPFTHVGTAHRRSLFVSASFDPSFRIAGDYHFLYPVLARDGAEFAPNYEIEMGEQGLSNAGRHRLRLLSEIRRIRIAHAVRPSLRQQAWFWAKFAWYATSSRLT